MREGFVSTIAIGGHILLEFHLPQFYHTRFLDDRPKIIPNPDIEKMDVTNYEDLERFF